MRACKIGGEKMDRNLDNFQQKQESSRLSSRSRGGEIVEVQGGHIIRSTGRKDRHSKVCTAKGPRDRRVRLSATTAIQFYDVQDRLGYDRPSKAVDWLMMKSKAAIDELAELPPWHPTSYLSGNTILAQEQAQTLHQQQISLHHGCVDAEPSSKRVMTTMVGSEVEANPSGSSSSFLPPSLDSDSIADTIKSFFPMGGSSAEGNSSNLQFHQSFQPSDLFHRTNEKQSQDLRLSLQSVQDPIFLHQNDQQNQHQSSTVHTEQVQAQIQAHALFSRASHLGFDVSGWSEQPAEIARLQKLTSWNPYGDTANTAGGGGYVFTSQPIQQQQQQQQQQPLLQQFLAQSQLLSQRGPLQSSNSTSIRTWVDPSSVVIPSADNQIQLHQPYQTVFPINPSSLSGIGFSGFSGFQIPARIHGEEEEHDGLSDKPSSASSDSRY